MNRAPIVAPSSRAPRGSSATRPWIAANPRGALVIALLRHIATTMLTLFRSVTQRSDERRHVPWNTLLGEIFLAFVTLTNAALGPRSLLA